MRPSSARSLLDLLPLVREHGTDLCAFCTDDREPDHLPSEGGINHMCRLAVKHGLAVEDALVLASIGAARANGLREHGAIAPAYQADFCLLRDLVECRPSKVFKEGRLVAAAGQALPLPPSAVPEWVRSSRNAPCGSIATFNQRSRHTSAEGPRRSTRPTRSPTRS